jgi:pyruvate dehydrogenase E1 component alpha subunit
MMPSAFTQGGLKTVAHFSIEYTQFLDADAKVVQALPAFADDAEYLKKLYTLLIRTRVFDTKAIALQRTGKLGTYPSTLGQEAIGVGIGAGMLAEDVFCPYYRDVATQLWRGVKMSEILLYWGGDERGSDFSNPAVKEDLPLCVPIASQTLHAVGIATAMKLRKEARVTVTTLGDGGTSRGDFYEALNLAGVWALPIVFVINNNQWAISVPRSQQSGALTLAQKGIAGGVFSEQVDGNDVIAVRYAVGEAVERARQGMGPTVIEAITYRMGDHTTADDAKRYRETAELETNKKQDPVERLKKYMISKGEWDENQDRALQERMSEEVLKAVEEYTSISKVPRASLFDYLYEQLPEALYAQKEELLSLKEGPQHG